LALHSRWATAVRFLTRTDKIPPITTFRQDLVPNQPQIRMVSWLFLQLSTHHNIQPILRMHEAAASLIYASSSCRAVTLLPQKRSPHKQERKKRNIEPRTVLVSTDTINNTGLRAASPSLGKDGWNGILTTRARLVGHTVLVYVTTRPQYILKTSTLVTGKDIPVK